MGALNTPGTPLKEKEDNLGPPHIKFLKRTPKIPWGTPKNYPNLAPKYGTRHGSGCHGEGTPGFGGAEHTRDPPTKRGR